MDKFLSVVSNTGVVTLISNSTATTGVL